MNQDRKECANFGSNHCRYGSLGNGAGGIGDKARMQITIELSNDQIRKLLRQVRLAVAVAEAGFSSPTFAEAIMGLVYTAIPQAERERIKREEADRERERP